MLGGCRMADSKDFGVVEHRNEVFGYEGLSAGTRRRSQPLWA